MYIIAPTLSLWLLDSPDGAILFRAIIIRDYFASTTGTTTSVLRVLDRFKWLSVVNALSSIATFLLVTIALLNGKEVIGYLTAITIVSVIQSIILLTHSNSTLKLRCGKNWWKADLSILQSHQNEIRTMLLSMKFRWAQKSCHRNS